MAVRRFSLVILAIVVAGCAGRAPNRDRALGPAPGTRADAPSRWTQITVGRAHTCAISAQKFLYCWGDNSSGQFGNGTFTYDPSDLPLEGGMADLENVAAVSAGGDHTCAIDGLGAMYCWGPFLGNEPSRLPELKPGKDFLSGVARKMSGVAVGWEYHACAARTTGQVLCIGYNHDGVWGNGQPPSSSLTRDFSKAAVIADATGNLAAGEHFVCAIRRSGDVACWGKNTFGQAGVSGGNAVLTPTTVQGLHSVKAVAAGFMHACGLHDDGTVSCWGSNASGQLGRGTLDFTAHPDPAPVTGLAGVKAIAAGGDRTCAVMGDASLRCWGANATYDVVPYSASSAGTLPSPVPIELLKAGTTAAVAVGPRHACTLPTKGGLRCWGHNEFGQLATGSTDPREMP